MENYKWASPVCWLDEQVRKADEATLRQMLLALMPSLDGDTIQDVFQFEMQVDGYFEELHECSSCGEELKHNDNGHPSCPSCDPDEE